MIIANHLAEKSTESAVENRRGLAIKDGTVVYLICGTNSMK